MAGRRMRGRTGFTNDYRVGRGGQLSVGTAGGGRSWLGQAETEAGSLVPMGVGKNNYMQFGRVPIGNYTNQMGGKTPFALEGGERAGFADQYGWDPQGKANTQAWKGMLGTGGYQTYGQPTGVFADRGIPKSGPTPFAGLAAGAQAQSPGGINRKALAGPIGTHGGRPAPSQIRPGGPGTGRKFPGGSLSGDGRMPNAGPQRGMHNQIGQKGKGKGKKKGGRKGGGKGLPGINAQGVGGMPDFNQGAVQPFLPQTPQFELDQAAASGELLGAGQQYGAGNDILANQLALERTRIGTDQGIARNRLDESLAERGLITSGLRAKAQTEQVATPYGRQLQDLATAGARGYGDLASQYGGANFGYTTDMLNAYMQRANDAYSQDLYGTNFGQYSAPDQAGFSPYYPPIGKPGGGGKKKPNKKKSNRRRNNRRR